MASLVPPEIGYKSCSMAAAMLAERYLCDTLLNLCRKNSSLAPADAFETCRIQLRYASEKPRIDSRYHGKPAILCQTMSSALQTLVWRLPILWAVITELQLRRARVEHIMALHRGSEVPEERPGVLSLADLQWAKSIGMLAQSIPSRVLCPRHQ